MPQDKNPDVNNNNSREVELPTPEKKNEDITTINEDITGNNKEDSRFNQAEETDEVNDEEKDEENDVLDEDDDDEDEVDEENEQSKDRDKINAGFDIDNTLDTGKKEKRGNDPERLERDDTNYHKTKDAKWQQDKLNEANNQNSSTNNENDKDEDRKTDLKDTRDDSILDRPKTETYEKNEGENIGGKIKRENPTHMENEKKRDRTNRKSQNKPEEQY